MPRQLSHNPFAYPYLFVHVPAYPVQVVCPLGVAVVFVKPSAPADPKADGAEKDSGGYD